MSTKLRAVAEPPQAQPDLATPEASAVEKPVTMTMATAAKNSKEAEADPVVESQANISRGEKAGRSSTVANGAPAAHSLSQSRNYLQS